MIKQIGMSIYNLQLSFSVCRQFICPVSVYFQSLKTLIFGTPMQNFNDEWKFQSFSFCDMPKLKYGIVQKKVASLLYKVLVSCKYVQYGSIPILLKVFCFNFVCYISSSIMKEEIKLSLFVQMLLCPLSSKLLYVIEKYIANYHCIFFDW